MSDPVLHCRWLATLSFLELCGAKKIAHALPKSLHHGEAWDYESELLQHAAEEFRHAYFFHKQIAKIRPDGPVSFAQIGGLVARRYLDRLDLRIARELRLRGYRDLRRGCYLLTTYAIEKRAELVYGTYEKMLRAQSSPISIASIIREENGHLKQIRDEIMCDDILLSVQDEACAYEAGLFEQLCAVIPSCSASSSRAEGSVAEGSPTLSFVRPSTLSFAINT